MNTSQASKIALVRVEIMGSEYSLELEHDVRRFLGDAGFPVVVTGEHAVAAGCPLDYQLVCYIAESLMPALIYDVFKFVVKKVVEAFRNAGKCDVPGTKARVIAGDCEYVLSANAHAGVDAGNVPYEDLFTKMGEFVSAEADKGFPVKRVEAPCELVEEGGHFTALCQGVGNFYLWKVLYKDGEKWPMAVFDAANGCFVDLARG